MLVTPSGIVIDVMLEQPLKQPGGMTVRVEGRVIEVRELAPEKQASPIEVTLSGTI